MTSATDLIVGVVLGVLFSIVLTLFIMKTFNFGWEWRSDVGCRLAALEQQELMPDWCITPTPQAPGGTA